MTPNEVADFFILRARESEDPITHLKIQKLAYYAQAWYLALNGKRLMNTRFQAWVHGPVSRELYDRFRSYGWKPIDEEVREPKVADDVREHLGEVWRVYGGFSALTLEQMTHTEAPWLNARGDRPSDALCETVISEDDMQTFYKARLG